MKPDLVPDAGHVLIIEDDADIRELEKISLQRAGWVVSEASTGERGLTMAAELLPEVIICDRRLPDLDGVDIIGRLGGEPSTAAIPVVLVTGMSDSKDLVAGIDAGAHDYLVKPFEMIELEVRCRAALRVSRQHRRLTESQRELRLLADNVSELVTRCSLDGVIRYASPSAKQKLGWEPHELVGRRFTELFHPDDPAPLSAPQLAIDEVTTVTRRVRRADGTFIWVETRARLVEGSDGDLEILSAARDVTERIATAAALAESEAAYRRIVDLAAEGIWVLDADQVVTFVNEHMAELLGLTVTELIGRSLFEFMDDEGRALAAARVQRRRAGITEAGDFKLIRGDGTPVWTSLNAAPILDDDGVYQGSIALVSDVTERHHHEEAVARSEARYRALLDHLPDAIAIVYDRDLRTVMASGAGLTQRGFDPDTMTGKHFDDLVAAEDAPTLRPIYEAALDGKPATIEFFSRSTQVDNLLDVVPIATTADGATEEILVLARDIGPLKARERALTAAEARWRAGFEQAPVGMAELATDGRYQRVNPALCQLLGYPADQLQTMTPVDISHPDDAERSRQTLADISQNNLERVRYEKRYLHADGHVVWCAVSVVPVTAENGRVDHLLVHYLDITELKRVETELQHLSLHDPLTGLLNRRGFESELDRHDAHVRRYGPTGALFVIDLDGLKAVNDTDGHDAGDEALGLVAEVLRNRLRATDAIARLGGDEFAVLLPQADETAATRVAESVVQLIRSRCLERVGAARNLRASIGVVLFDEASPSGRDLLADADRAMYTAKIAGGDRHEITRRAEHPTRLTEPV
jgi:diguanylate cyclase (GGDEF)-like protein/PAS domain S-box-containing protein